MTVGQIIELVGIILLAAAGIFFTIRNSKKHTLPKLVTILILLSIALTWVFSYGYFQGAEFYEYGMNSQGLADIPNIIYYAISFASDKIIFLFAIGAFYAIISKCNGYKKLVSNIAKKFKGKEILFVLLTSFIFAVQASLFAQSFAALIFVPLFVSIMTEMKFDKLSTFAATFGGILVGTLGATYGGEGLYYFNYYTGATTTTAILYRVLVFVIAFILFNVFNILHIKKVGNSKSKELVEDPFKVEHVNAKTKTWPVITLLSILGVLNILGYVNWSGYFGIECFTKFHTWLTGLTIGDFAIFASIFGKLGAAFGAWTLFHGTMVLLIIALIMALIYGVKFDEIWDSFGEGAKKVGPGVALFIGAYMVMVAAYMSPFVPTISNLMFKGVTKFNPFGVSFIALLSNIFHIDFGFSGYIVATYFTSTFAANLEVIHTIFTTLYGFVGFFVPTNAALILGLSYLNVEYKSWMKYAWIFIVSILVILLVLFTIMTYI